MHGQTGPTFEIVTKKSSPSGTGTPHVEANTRRTCGDDFDPRRFFALFAWLNTMRMTMEYRLETLNQRRETFSEQRMLLMCFLHDAAVMSFARELFGSDENASRTHEVMNTHCEYKLLVESRTNFKKTLLYSTCLMANEHYGKRQSKWSFDDDILSFLINLRDRLVYVHGFCSLPARSARLFNYNSTVYSNL